MQYPGVFIVLEGSDGSGKTTQFNLLKERLEAAGYDLEIFDFPQYDQPSSHFVKSYLNGEYGPANQINPYAASMFYALDRFEAAPKIRQAIDAGKVVLSNRYTGSNMAHQGAKFSSPAQQRGFFVWAESLEYQLLGIPRPNINFYLKVPAEVAYELIARKNKRNYTDRVRDQHEADIDHLKNAVSTYDLLCGLFPKDFKAIECTKNDQILGIPQISNLIWAELKPYLQDIPRHKPHSKVVNLNAPEPSEERTQETKTTLKTKDQQLNITLNNVSLAATKEIGLAGFNINSIKPSSTNSYFIPQLLNDAKTKYKIFYKENYASQQLIAKLLKKSRISSKQQIDALSAVTPLGTLADIRVSISRNRLISAIEKLNSDDNEEYGLIANNLAKKASLDPASIKKIVPSKKLLQGLIDNNFSSSNEDLKILTAIPRNEMDVIREVGFSGSELSMIELTQSLDSLSYDQKSKVLNNILATPGSNDNNMAYELEAMLSGSGLNFLISKGIFDKITAQNASPRFGYNVPPWLEKTGAEDIFISCFDDSLTLFSDLEGNSVNRANEYVVLLGNRLRVNIKTNLRELVSLHKACSELGAPAEIKRLKTHIYESVTLYHPLTGQWLLNQPQSSKKQVGKAIDTTERNRGGRKQTTK